MQCRAAVVAIHVAVDPSTIARLLRSSDCDSNICVAVEST